MSITTNLQVSPYFDDFNEDKNYQKILFKPGVAVQTRELNQLQTILQKQVESLGDQILKRGTIINGCNPQFFPSVPYVKITDVTSQDAAVDLQSYKGLLVKNSANLVSRIIDFAPGFESRDPDLNTLYLSFLNRGDSGEEKHYANGTTLTIYNDDFRLYNIDINNNSQGFSNSDSVVVLSAIQVQNTTGGLDFANGMFDVGETITQDTTNAQAVITAIDTTTDPNFLTLRLRPITAQLEIANTASWSFLQNFNIIGGTTGNEAVLTQFVGSGATARISTTSTGAVSRVNLLTQGRGYIIPPYVTISTTSASQAQITTLSLSAMNHIANVSVASGDFTDPTGFAYGLSVTDGTIYQKGFFQKVNPQFIIVEKYANTPDAVSVGFYSEESIITSLIDRSLVDNASGFLNENAPGADRLQLTPKLVLKTDAEAKEDNDFLSIFKFKEGKLYSQSTTTQFSAINDELARRTYDKSGNFILDQFDVNTKSEIDISRFANNFSYVISPGEGYINGYRVQTIRNYSESVEKAKEIVQLTTTSFDLVYGNYIRVNEFAGIHAFTVGQQISLRNTAKQYITINPTATLTAAGSEIGKARIRSIVPESGEPGTPNAVYRLYLFDIIMNAGRSFDSVRSIYANMSGSINGVADIVLSKNAAGQDICQLFEFDKNSLVLNTKLPLKQVSNINYTYRTYADNVVANTAGIITLSADAGAAWTFTGIASSVVKNEFIIIPEENIISNTELNGTYSSDSGGVLTGSSTDFVSNTNPILSGDYLYLNDTSNTAIIRVISVANNTSLTFSPTGALTNVAGGAKISRAFPKNIPIPFATRSNRSANVVGTTTLLNLGSTLVAQANVAIVYNQRLTNANSIAKTVNRNAYIKIEANSHPESTNGPWCIGHSDIIRLKNVYEGGTTSGNNVTKNFYIDHNQNENFYDLGYLYKKPTSAYTVDSNETLLVEFDVFTHTTEGAKTISSYNINDTISLSSSISTINTLEVPEFIGANSFYYDLIECIDFRPMTVNTEILESNSASVSIPVNPSEAIASSRFDSDNKKFPVPEGSNIVVDIQYYLPRKDSILVNINTEFEILINQDKRGGSNDNEYVIAVAEVAPYPSLSVNLSQEILTFIDKNIANENFLNERVRKYTTKVELADKQIPAYTMEQINKLEKRIENLEYTVNLSLLDKSVADRNIPSSIDSTLSRFKYGFFVDNYVDDSFSEIDNPEYSASFYNYNLYPATKEQTISLKPAFNSKVSNNVTSTVLNNKISYNANRVSFVSQTNVTDGIVLVPPAPQEPPVIVTEPDQLPVQDVIVSNTETGEATIQIPEPGIRTNQVFIQNINKNLPKSYVRGAESNQFVLSSSIDASGLPIKIYFDMFKSNFGGGNFIRILQSPVAESIGQVIFESSSGAINNLTSEERRSLYNKAYKHRNNSINRWLTGPNFQIVNTNRLNNIGKIQLTFDTTKGRFLTVQVFKFSPEFAYVIEYPADEFKTIVTAQSESTLSLDTYRRYEDLIYIDSWYK